jgi:hypothetical protein
VQDLYYRMDAVAADGRVLKAYKPIKVPRATGD